MTTGTQPASIASVTASPKPSWREACTYTDARAYSVGQLLVGQPSR